ncbi:FAD-dependent monooxygenase [Streptomyces antibioticus]|uniref:FAD-dependent monooxygenase n=1 Tax=Streptomyces antibioticus TaxID=1890 RepID=UPI0033AADD4E
MVEAGHQDRRGIVVDWPERADHPAGPALQEPCGTTRCTASSKPWASTRRSARSPVPPAECGCWTVRTGCWPSSCATVRTEELTDRARLLELIAPWTPGIAEDELHVLRTAFYTFRAQVADRWRKGRVFLLGDAAHLTPPFIGQGMGAGMRDAYNLAWKLARVLTGRASEALLDTYQAERQRHARQLIRTAVGVGAVMTGGGTGTVLARNAVLPALSRVPGASGLVLSAVSPPLRSGPLVGFRRPGHPRPGTVCPQPLIPDADGTPRLLDDLLGENFALLATAPISPALHALVRALDARVLNLHTPRRQQPGTGGDGQGADPGTGALVRWLGRAGAVLLRPDRVVLATATRPRHGRACGDDLAAAAAAWAPILCSGAGTTGSSAAVPTHLCDGG